MSILLLVLATSMAYLLGSFPTSVLLSKVLGHSDPRTVGSGHTGGLNTLRTVGWGAAILVGLIDLSKGALATWLAGQVSDSPWALAAGATAAVAGHCWPFTTAFRGGMGLGTGFGALLVVWATQQGPWPWPVLLVAVAWFVGKALLNHSARALLVAVLLLLPGYWLAGASPEILAMTAGISLVVFVRHLSDFKRVYP